MSYCALKILQDKQQRIENQQNYGGVLWALHPWKHFVKRFDSLFFKVKNSLRGRSGCLMRICCMYTLEKETDGNFRTF